MTQRELEAYSLTYLYTLDDTHFYVSWASIDILTFKLSGKINRRVNIFNRDYEDPYREDPNRLLYAIMHTILRGTTGFD